MLSQDNSPSHPATPRFRLRSVFCHLAAFMLGGLGVLTTTTQLEWQVPVLGQNSANAVASVVASTAVNQSASPKVIETISATKVALATAVPATRAPTPSHTGALGKKLLDINFQSVKLVTSSAEKSNARKSSTTPRRTIRQPGGGIVVKHLPRGHRVPVSNGGMPKFYTVVLEPKGHKTPFGLMQRKPRRNFGYDHQDIFTGEVPDGAYVLHCHQVGVSVIRAMCWRELQVSEDQWVQYRFPRAQLKDWWKIEQKVRANIG